MTSGAQPRPTTLSPIDVRLRVLAAMLEPPVALARILGLPLDDLQQLVAIGYFRELQARGLSWEMIARRLQKSRRTVASLSKTAAAEGPPLGESARIRLRRRIVRVLAERGACNAASIAGEIVEASPDDVDAELEQLTMQGIVDRRDDDTFALAADTLDLTSDDLDHRLDSLRHFLEAVAHVVYRRFFSRERDAEAFARVLTFTATRDRLASMREKQFDALAREAIDADAAATSSPDATQASIAICFVETPADLHWKGRRR